MRKLKFFIIAAFFFLSFVTFAISYRAGSHGDEVVFGGSKIVRENESINGNLAIFGGTVLIEEKAVVNGDVVIFGGHVLLDGHITGDVVNFGGIIERGKASKVSGKVALIGGDDTPLEPLDTMKLNEVMGREGISPEVSEWQIANTEHIGPSFTERIFHVLGEMFATVLKTMVFGVIGLLLTIFLPNHVRRVGQTAEIAPIASIGIGCMSLFAIIAAIFFTAITIIGIPIALLIPFLTVAAIIFGWIGLGFLFGNRLLHAVEIHSPRPAAAAAIGSGGLMLFSNLTALIPIVSWIVIPIFWVWGLGATVLTRGGTRPYPSRLAKINESSFERVDDLDPKGGPNWSTDDLFADLAFDLGIEDEEHHDEMRRIMPRIRDSRDSRDSLS